MVEPILENVEIQEEHDSVNPKFRIKYRSNSIVSFGSVSEASQSDSLPVIKILGTGGTIALKGSSSSQTAGYKVDLTIEELVQAIPDLSATCILEYEQVLNIDSKEMGTKELFMLHDQIQKDLKTCDGIVITHGTDTMEETAFFLQLTCDSYKPIVMCGSMRPSTAISSDGPMNLYQAIVIVASKSLRGRGVLVALNDQIGNGFYITKLNANSLDTFKSVGQGFIGNFVNNEIHYYFPAAKPLGVTFFNLNSNSELVEVPIVYAHQGLNNDLIGLIVKGTTARGLVLATMGAGSMKDTTNEYLADLCRKMEGGDEFPVVYSKRAMDGMVPLASLPENYNNTIASGYLNPQKARILLQLCLYSGFSLAQIKRAFRGVYGG